jgi:hypothetical protein
MNCNILSLAEVSSSGIHIKIRIISERGLNLLPELPPNIDMKVLKVVAINCIQET